MQVACGQKTIALNPLELMMRHFIRSEGNDPVIPISNVIPFS